MKLLMKRIIITTIFCEIVDRIKILCVEVKKFWDDHYFVTRIHSDYIYSSRTLSALMYWVQFCGRKDLCLAGFLSWYFVETKLLNFIVATLHIIYGNSTLNVDSGTLHEFIEFCVVKMINMDNKLEWPSHEGSHQFQHFFFCYEMSV